MTPGIVFIPSSSTLVQGINRGGALLFRESSAVPATAPSRSLLVELYKRWFQISSLIRFSVSGNIGVVCFYIIERMLYAQLCQIDGLPDILEEYKDSVSYFFGYLLQIFTQHLLNATLVYGLDTIDTREKYLKTLIGQFSVYGFSLFGSTILNLALLRYGIDRNTSFFTTMILFAIVNYFLIQWVVQRATAAAYEKDMAARKKGYTLLPNNNNKNARNKRTVLQRVSRGGATESRSWFGRIFRRQRREYNSGEEVDRDEVNESCVAFVRQYR
ncbi:unnamed protein product [Cylindrotheca closterium]|uniref:Uncharacterized protein n=1 Tax=Cylindrotheca closterium TaxID=2856 RepID=A0AAD2CPS7_9STRA|nr:unnamed protein product [Cylindrotheca closterium]